MTKEQNLWLSSVFGRLAAPVPTERVSEWCERCIVFQEPGCTGPYSFSGREYLRTPLDWYSDPSGTDLYLCFSTRAGKTRIFFGGKAWLIVHEPSRMLCVMPNTYGTGGAQNVSRTRFQPMLRASPELAALIPGGNRRHEFKALQQIIGGSIVDWVGSNSPANLASNPARYVEQDEIDKYRRMGDREADPSKLADERAKEFSNPKRAKASTPTLVSGAIWQGLLQSDLRRRFMPCPHCGTKVVSVGAKGVRKSRSPSPRPSPLGRGSRKAKHRDGALTLPVRNWVVFSWAPQFTVLPKVDCEAYVRWDPKAKLLAEGHHSPGSTGWDLDKVMATAHALCPFCEKQILDAHKFDMDRAGEWQPTSVGATGGRPSSAWGFHLPSMYAISRETNFGSMARRFILASHSLMGLQGFINSDLAEPYQAQDMIGHRVELIADRLAAGHHGEAKRIMWTDCQARAPHFWYVVREWAGPNSHGVAAGSCNTWEEIRHIQIKNKVPDVGFFVDSGWGAKAEAEVYRNCASYCEFVDQPDGLPLSLGWNPAKGMPGHKRWKDPATGNYEAYFLRPIDPFSGTSDAGKVSMGLFEFSAEFFKDILENLRLGKGGMVWSVPASMATEEYWRHLDGQYKVQHLDKWSGRIVQKWIKRSEHWPDHLFACEYGQAAAANFLQLLPVEAVPG